MARETKKMIRDEILDEEDEMNKTYTAASLYSVHVYRAQQFMLFVFSNAHTNFLRKNLFSKHKNLFPFRKKTHSKMLMRVHCMEIFI